MSVSAAPVSYENSLPRAEFDNEVAATSADASGMPKVVTTGDEETVTAPDSPELVDPYQ